MENTRWTSPTNHGLTLHRPRMSEEEMFEGWCASEGRDEMTDQDWEDWNEAR